MNRFLFAALFLVPVLYADCDGKTAWQRVTIKQREAQGIGYDAGYTSLDYFGAFSPTRNALLFIDTRAHVLTNGSVAVNAGLGARSIADKWTTMIFGGSVYYDYRYANSFQYNQIGLGLEALGAQWEARVNGYIPLGKTKPNTPYSFQYFSGNSMYIGQNQVVPNALGEIDSEIGYHFRFLADKDIDLYLGAGPYYLQTQYNQAAAGGAVRVTSSFAKYVTAAINYSYDRFYKNIVQGEVGFHVAFGREKEYEPLAKTCDCDLAFLLNERIVQDVFRQEIIPTRNQTLTNVNGMVAINPVTGQPYRIVFINNTSHSAGTFESPYPTFTQASANSGVNDLLYVFPGDGTSQGMNSGITLKDNQSLLGASVGHNLLTTVGTVYLPPQASVMPQISNSSGNGVTLANNNTVSGFYITSNGGSTTSGIVGLGNNWNPTIDQNIFVSGGANTNGLKVTNPLGLVSATNSSFSGFSETNGGQNGDGILVAMTTGALDAPVVSVSDCAFSNFNAQTGFVGGNPIYILASGSTIASVKVIHNSFKDISTSTVLTGAVDTIYVYANGGVVQEVVISDCTLNNIQNGSNAIYVRSSLGGSIGNLTVSSCSFSNMFGGVFGVTAQGIVANTLVENCSFLNFYGGSYGTYGSGGTGTNLGSYQVNNCTFDNFTSTCIGVAFGASSSTGNFSQASINNCIFKNMSNTNDIRLNVTNGNFSNFEVNSCTFQNHSSTSYGVQLIHSGGTLGSIKVANSNFSDFNTGNGILYQGSAANTTPVTVTNNSFTTSAPTTSGWGALFTVSGGTTNLSFTGNSANPASAAPNNPIHFTRNAGTFDVYSATADLNGVELANNNVIIDTTGTITYLTPP